MTIIQGGASFAERGLARSLSRSRFGPGGVWIFEIELITSDEEPIVVDAIFDSGFSNGYLALNAADVELTTASGLSRFDIDQGKVMIGGKTYLIPVHVGQEIPDILLGLRWQNHARIIVDYRAGLLILELET
ncbi:MAG: aspartyl protease [Cyanobacteria bacterium J06592_8]